MEMINMNKSKIDNMSMVDMSKTSADSIEIKKKAEDTSKDVLEPTKEQAQEAQKKHVITYIGNSTFTDSTGHEWHKHDEATYNDNEYNKRTDLHFMVQYGEMKHTTVSI
jgi:hypothetical protein